MRRRRNWFNNPIAFVFTAVSFCCLLIITISILNFPDLTPKLNRRSTYTKSPGNSIGAFGEMMIQMLPEDLTFTIFIPTQAAFARELRLKVNESLTAEKSEDTYAVVSRVLGFSAVPWKIDSAAVPFGKEMEYDSISGFQLFVEKKAEGRLVVNGVKSETVDMRRGEIVVHLMDGVIMDAEFQESIQPF